MSAYFLNGFESIFLNTGAYPPTIKYGIMAGIHRQIHAECSEALCLLAHDLPVRTSAPDPIQCHSD